jgi:inner membrane protein YidH
MSDTRASDHRDRRWPRSVYGIGSEPDPRFSFANERTFLAWIRTGLGFLAAGVAIAAVASFSDQLRLEVRIAAVLLILCGMGCAIDGITRWMRNERAMRLGEPLHSSALILVLTIGLVLVALIGFIVVSFI